jgi:TPR repeat protein
VVAGWTRLLKHLAVLVAVTLTATAPLGAAAEDSRDAAQVGGVMATLYSWMTPLEEGAATALDSIVPPVTQGLGTVEALIGDAYYYGHGVARDYAEAARWYRSAAERDNAMAQSTLGDIYYYGRGVPQDFVAAVQWWELAAEQGVAVAQLNLGVMYANGDGVARDYVKSHLYTNLAAAHLPPGEDRDIALKNRDIVGKLMDATQLAEAQRLARDWQPKSLQ